MRNRDVQLFMHPLNPVFRVLCRHFNSEEIGFQPILAQKSFRLLRAAIEVLVSVKQQPVPW